MTRVALRLLAATVAACVALLLGAAPAFAHTRLESSDPADKSSVDTAPESVSLTFNEDISAEFASISVVGPDGTNYATGPVSAAGGQVSTAVSPLGPAGAYEIGYRVVSDDGHPVQGKLAFTLTTPGPAASAPTAAPAVAPAAAPTAQQVRPPRRRSTRRRAAGPARVLRSGRGWSARSSWWRSARSSRCAWAPELSEVSRSPVTGFSTSAAPRRERRMDRTVTRPDARTPALWAAARGRHHGGGGRAGRRAEQHDAPGPARHEPDPGRRGRRGHRLRRARARRRAAPDRRTEANRVRRGRTARSSPSAAPGW